MVLFKRSTHRKRTGHFTLTETTKYGRNRPQEAPMSNGHPDNTISDLLAFILAAEGPVQVTYERQPFPLIEAKDGSVKGADPQRIIGLRVRRDDGQPASLSFSGSAHAELRRIDRGLRIQAEPLPVGCTDCQAWRYTIATSDALLSSGRGATRERIWLEVAIIEDHESHKNTAMRLAVAAPPREEAGCDERGYRNTRIRLALQWLFGTRFADFEPTLTGRLLHEIEIEGFNGKPLKQVNVTCTDGTRWTIASPPSGPLSLVSA